MRALDPFRRRVSRPARGLGGVLLVAWGCGGNVVVDSQPSGTGGSAAGTGGSATSSSGATGPLTCEFLCGGPVGLCGCAGSCSDGKMRAIGCGGGTSTGVTCDCVVDGQSVGTCDAPALACQLVGSCCQPIFGG